MVPGRVAQPLACAGRAPPAGRVRNGGCRVKRCRRTARRHGDGPSARTHRTRDHAGPAQPGGIRLGRRSVDAAGRLRLRLRRHGIRRRGHRRPPGDQPDGARLVPLHRRPVAEHDRTPGRARRSGAGPIASRRGGGVSELRRSIRQGGRRPRHPASVQHRAARQLRRGRSDRPGRRCDDRRCHPNSVDSRHGRQSGRWPHCVGRPVRAVSRQRGRHGGRGQCQRHGASTKWCGRRR